jgi:hypothetical protein
MSSFNFTDLPEETTIEFIKNVVAYISAIETTPDADTYIEKRYENILDALTKMCTHSEKFSKFVVSDQRAEKQSVHDYR